MTLLAPMARSSMSAPGELRRVEVTLDLDVHREIRAYAAAEDIAFVSSLLRAVLETWAGDPKLQARVLPRAREIDADSRKRQGRGG